jgi:hypothetical protein
MSLNLTSSPQRGNLAVFKMTSNAKRSDRKFRPKKLNNAESYNEVFSGYQPGKVVPFCRDQRFEDHLCPRPQGC